MRLFDNWSVATRMTYAGDFHNIARGRLLAADVLNEHAATGILDKKPSVPIRLCGGDDPFHENGYSIGCFLGSERKHVRGVGQHLGRRGGLQLVQRKINTEQAATNP